MWSSVSYGVMLYQSINVINNCKVNTFWHSGKTGVSKGRFIHIFKGNLSFENPSGLFYSTLVNRGLQTDLTQKLPLR